MANIKYDPKNDFYELITLKVGAMITPETPLNTINRLRAAYFQEFRPEIGGDSEYAGTVNNAFDILTNSSSKGKYDQERGKYRQSSRDYNQEPPGQGTVMRKREYNKGADYNPSFDEISKGISEMVFVISTGLNDLESTLEKGSSMCEEQPAEYGVMTLDVHKRSYGTPSSLSYGYTPTDNLAAVLIRTIKGYGKDTWLRVLEIKDAFPFRNINPFIHINAEGFLSFHGEYTRNLVVDHLPIHPFRDSESFRELAAKIANAESKGLDSVNSICGPLSEMKKFIEGKVGYSKSRLSKSVSKLHGIPDMQ